MQNKFNPAVVLRPLSAEEIDAISGASNYLGYTQDAGSNLRDGWNIIDYYGGGWTFNGNQTDDGLPDWDLYVDYQSKTISCVHSGS